MDVYENFDPLKDWGLHFIVSLRRKKSIFFVNLNEWMVDKEIFIVNFIVSSSYFNQDVLTFTSDSLETYTKWVS